MFLICLRWLNDNPWQRIRKLGLIPSFYIKTEKMNICATVAG